MKKIFILGCAKSGTTLMRRLFHAFEGVNIIGEEIKLNDFIEYCNIHNTYEAIDFETASEAIIGKRLGDEVFSHILPIKERQKQLKLISDNDIGVIVMIRDGRAVITTKDRWVQVDRWVKVMNQIRSFKGSNYFPDINVLFVKYEDICLYPEVVQKAIELKFNLKSIHCFLDYPGFIAKECQDEMLDDKPVAAMGGYDYRKIDHFMRSVDGYEEIVKKTSEDMQKAFYEHIEWYEDGSNELTQLFTVEKQKKGKKDGAKRKGKRSKPSVGNKHKKRTG